VGGQKVTQIGHCPVKMTLT